MGSENVTVKEELIEKLQKEWQEVNDKLVKLDAFLQTESKVAVVSPFHLRLLDMQRGIMKNLCDVLMTRIDYIQNQSKTNEIKD